MYQFNLNLRWFAKNAKILVVVLFWWIFQGRKGRESTKRHPRRKRRWRWRYRWRRRCRVRSEPVRETMSSMHPPLIPITNFPRIWSSFQKLGFLDQVIREQKGDPSRFPPVSLPPVSFLICHVSLNNLFCLLIKEKLPNTNTSTW